MSTALVSLVNGIPTTTSQKVAEVFGKTHDKVCRDIRNLLKDEPEWCAANFGETSFEVHQPNGGTRKTAMYTMTRQGMTLLVMGYTGPKARHFKIAYIQAFDCMEEQLKAMRTAPTLPPLSTTSDRRKLNNLVREWAAISGQSFPDCWAEVHVAFEIDAVASLPVTQVKDAEDYVRARIREYSPALPEPDFPLELANYGKKGKEFVNLWEDLKEAERLLKGCANGIMLACNSGCSMYMTPEKHLFYKVLTKSASHAAASVTMAMQAVNTCLSVKGEVDFCSI